jgi:hypothetical protein
VDLFALAAAGKIDTTPSEEQVKISQAKAELKALDKEYDAASLERQGQILKRQTELNNALESGAETSAQEAKAEQPKEQPKPAASPAQLTDFGQKIGGARKDRVNFADREATADDIANQPLSKTWPKSEIDAIEDPKAAALAHALRQSLPNKPQKGYKLNRWVAAVTAARDLLRDSAEAGADTILDRMERIPGTPLYHLAAHVRLLQSVDRQHWDRINELRWYPDAFMFGEGGVKIPAPRATALLDDRRIDAPSQEALAAQIALRLGASLQVAAKAMAFEVRGRTVSATGEGSFYIMKKGDPLYRPLKKFADSKEALNYVRDNNAELVKLWEELKERENVKERDLRTDTNRERTGANHRDGRDVTPEMFQNAFQFRGVEFGNWVADGKNAKERQGMLNQAYDAMLDLASILNLPPSALSLNGQLGLRFGSNGSGWAAAHYEPGNIAINLTKTRGAGTLAHEWFHALDHYFQRKRNESGMKGNKGDYVTQSPERYYDNVKTGHRLSQTRINEIAASGRIDMSQWKPVEGIRPEVEAAFFDLVQTLNKSPMWKRASLIDKGKSDGYWGSIIERAARSFENYVIHKMAENGYQNDYLANVVSVEDFARDNGRYPYLIGEEIAPVAEAFDNLFSTIQTRQTESGVEMYSLPENEGQALPESNADAVRAALDAKGYQFARVVWDPSAPSDMADPDVNYSIAGRSVQPGLLPDNLADVPVSTRRLNKHPEFAAAKAGDARSAAAIVQRTIKPETLWKVRDRLKPGVPVVFLPVMHLDPGPLSNQLPRAYAEALAHHLGGTVETRIGKLSGRANTNATEASRVANVQTFAGPIRTDVQYVLVDDTLSSGDTFLSLLEYVQQAGGQVSAVTALADGRWQNKLRPDPKNIAKILDRAGINEETFTSEFGFPITQLSGGEAHVFANLKGNWRGVGRLASFLIGEGGTGVSPGGRGAGIGGIEGDLQGLAEVQPTGSDRESRAGLAWEARFKNGQVEINAAHVAPEDAVFKAEHELGHALWKDAGFKGQFERLWNALSPGQQQAIDATVEELYSEAGENVRFEEKRVRALELIRKEAAKTEAGRTAWQRFITWLWASISKLTKGKSTTSPEALQQLAASMVEIGRKIVAGNLVRKVSPGVYLANNAAMVEIGGEGKFSIRAYHGTPHKIGPEGFSLTKIGTGEGAQAYGYGLYFAANQNVAETYRKVLTSRQGTSNFADGSTVPTWVASAVQNGRANELRQDFAKRKADAIKAVETKDRQWWLDQANILGFDAILAAIDRLEQGERAEQGNLYTVELLAESDEMLDWDKPLSEQSEKVKGALKNVWPKSADPLENVQSGRGLYDTIAFSRGLDAGPSLPGWMSGERISDAQAASAALSSVGIKGIRYLDGSSRGLNGVKLSWRSPQDQARYGTDMALDFADLELSRANGDMAKAIKALKAEHKRSGNPSAKDAAEALEQGAIISKPNAAYNYVIFDDSLVKILEENGEARYSMAEKNSGTNPENGVGSGHGKASGQASNPKGNLRAEQLVARAKGSPVRIEQPEHYGLQGELHGRPWVRERDSSSLSEIDQQEASLEQWAKATGNFIEADELKKVADLADREAKGNEHDVLVFKNANPPFVIRRTKLDMYGMAWATPAEYLQRWRLSNAVFPDTAAAFIGFTRNARGNGVILTAQPYFEGTKKPQKAINAALAKLGFQKIPGDPTSYLNPETKVEIHDAKPDNIIFDKAGNMMPFDVWINDPQNYFQVAPEITPVSPRTPAPSPAESTGPDAGLRKDALERALGELQPIMRKVWTDLLAGKNVDEVAKAAGISVGGVENIIRIVRGKAIALQSVADPARASQVNPNNGRPDLALSTNPMVNAVDAARNLEGSPGYRPRDLVVGEAEARLAANYDGTFQELLSKARKLEPMSDTDVAAVKLILAREAVAGRLDTTERRMALAELIFGYREIGSATARSLAMRFDPHHNPADRAAQYLAEALLSPDPKTSKSLSKAKSAEERQAIMKAWLRRVDGIKTALRREGVDADALLKQHQAVQQAITRADDLNPDAARVYRIQINRLSPQDRAILETARALQVAGQRDMRIVMSRAAAAGAVPIEYAVRRYKQFQAELANEMRAVAAQAARVAAQRAVAPGAPGVTSSEMEILADIGFGSLDDYFDDNGAALPDKKVRKNKNRAAKKQPAGSARQYEPVPGATPPTGQADQEQLPGMDNAPPPARPPQPPPEIYGDYDLTDPANPLFPALRSGPNAVSMAARQKQIPSSNFPACG